VCPDVLSSLIDQPPEAVPTDRRSASGSRPPRPALREYGFKIEFVAERPETVLLIGRTK